MLVAVTIPAGAHISLIEQGDGSAKLNLPAHVIRQAYCDLVAAEVETNRRSRQPEKVMSS